MSEQSTNTLCYCLRRMALVALALAISACSGSGNTLPPADMGPGTNDAAELSNYRIGPGDVLDIFVWRNPEISTTVPVRPDGKISMPLVEDMIAAEKTPSQLARDLEDVLATYIKSPTVNVIVTQFVGTASEQIRVVGQAANPQAIPFREGMAVLDVMIAVGGLGEFAAGNRAKLIRNVNGKPVEYRVRLGDLMNDGDISQNFDMLPGDIIIIPEAMF